MEILNTVQVSGKGVAFVLFLLAFAAVIYAIFMFQDRKWPCGLLISVLAIWLTVLAIKNVVRLPHTRYEVCFDKDYPVSELIENYEIVDQRGDILILEDKDEIPSD